LKKKLILRFHTGVEWSRIKKLNYKLRSTKMSSRLDFKNEKIGDYFFEIKDIFLKNIKFLTFSTLLFLLIGVIYSFNITPKFSVSSIIVSNQPDGESQQMQLGGLSSLLNTAAPTTKLDDLVNVIKAYPTAEQLWDLGYDSVFFGFYYDADKDIYPKPPPELWQRIKSRILGYDLELLEKEYSPLDLKNIINSLLIITPLEYKINDSKKQYGLRVSMTTDNPELAKKIIPDLLTSADNVLKETRIEYAEAQVSFLKEQLQTVEDSDIRMSFIDIMKGHYRKLALLSSDLPFSYKVIEGPIISNGPVYPNLKFIYIFFPFIGFSLSFVYLYLRKLFFVENN